jgi:hypothetical protein
MVPIHYQFGVMHDADGWYVTVLGLGEIRCYGPADSGGKGYGTEAEAIEACKIARQAILDLKGGV